jgi:parallel beta-helix repeat protein
MNSLDKIEMDVNWGIWKMNKRYDMLIVSATILVLSLVGTASATNWTVDSSGGADFTGIQAAINNAKDGDTIIVHSGVYYENVVVDKLVTLKGINLPVVDAGGEGSAITLTADGITLVGFTATNSGIFFEIAAGIKVTSNNNTITGNNVSSNMDGIGLYYFSNNNTITGNNVSNNWYGIDLFYPSSNNNTISGNSARNNSEAGIRLSSSCNNTISSNNVSNNWYGIDLTDSSNNNTISGNSASNNNLEGISLYDSRNNIITGNTLVNDGLFVSYSYQNTVEDNIVNGKPLVYLEDALDYKVEDAGQVILVNCTNITVENLDLSNTSVGVELWKTEDSKVLNNNVSNNSNGGIRLYFSSNNTISDNNVSNNKWHGIKFDNSSNNTITGNVFVNDGLFVSYSYQNTVEDNIVNGKPLVYLEDVSDCKVEDAGQVILVNCTNITVENLVLSNTYVGVTLLKTRNSRISNNTVCNNGYYISLRNTARWDGYGIYLHDSSNNNITGNNVSNNRIFGIHLTDSSNNNTITGNNVNNNDDGIELYDSSNNNIIGNNVSNNSDFGIHLTDSSNNNTIIGNNVNNNLEEGIELSRSSNNNTITGNNVNNYWEGIELFFSNNNKIYLNNFIAHTYYNVHSDSTNIWNSPLEITYAYDGTTYKSYLGNYWDDYEGTDADGDGIGDTHYSIDSDSDESDDYPLMKPFENYIIPSSAHTQTPGFNITFPAYTTLPKAMSRKARA